MARQLGRAQGFAARQVRQDRSITRAESMRIAASTRVIDVAGVVDLRVAAQHGEDIGVHAAHSSATGMLRQNEPFGWRMSIRGEVALFFDDHSPGRVVDLFTHYQAVA